MLVVGSLWGRPTWGTWWEWDARLTTTAILFFLYLGYLALRRTGATVGRARQALRDRGDHRVRRRADRPLLGRRGGRRSTRQGTVFNEKLDVKINGSMAVTLLLSVALVHDAVRLPRARTVRARAARRRSRGTRAATRDRRAGSGRTGGAGVIPQVVAVSHNWNYVGAGYAITAVHARRVRHVDQAARPAPAALTARRRS